MKFVFQKVTVQTKRFKYLSEDLQGGRDHHSPGRFGVLPAGVLPDAREVAATVPDNLQAEIIESVGLTGDMVVDAVAGIARTHKKTPISVVADLVNSLQSGSFNVPEGSGLRQIYVAMNHKIKDIKTLERAQIIAVIGSNLIQRFEE